MAIATRRDIIDVLRKTGFAEGAEEAARLRPDPVDLDRVARFLAPYGTTKDELISQVGGSP